MQRFAIVKFIDENTTTWQEFSKRYFDYCGTYKSFNSMRSVVKPSIKIFGEFIGRMNPRPKLMTEITEEMADAFLCHMRTAFKLNSIQTRISVLRCLFKYAIIKGVIMSNPFDHIKLRGGQIFGGRLLNDDEIRVILSRIRKENLRRAVTFSLYTGLRRGEIADLDWSWIKNLYGDDSVTLTVPAEKSKSCRERFILLHPTAISCLGKRKISGSIFNLSRGQINFHFTKAWKDSGIGRVKFHDLRHTMATRMMEYMDKIKSPDIFPLLDMLGHSTVMAARVYQKISRARYEKVVNGMNYNIN